MKIKIILVLVFVLSISSVFAQADWVWEDNAGGTGSDRGRAIGTDSVGNSYITGSFSDNATFGTTVLSSNGESDIFVAKMDVNGNWLWAIGTGSNDYDGAYGICVDSAGNAYVTGYFCGTISFGDDELISNGNSDIFVAKINSAGVWQWANSAGDLDWDTGYDIELDSFGNIFVTGRFNGTVSFGTHTIISNGNFDVFIAKLDSSGNWLSVLRGGGSNYDLSWNLSLDGFNNPYISGRFYLNVSFGSTTLASYGGYDIFIAKANSDLTSWQWARKAGGLAEDNGLSIKADNSGNCYVAGTFYESATFGTTIKTGTGYEMFVSKLNSNGEWLWTISNGGDGTDVIDGFDIDASGNFYVTGYFSDTCQFGTNSITSSGDRDIFVSKLNSAGDEWLWGISAGGSGNDFGVGIDINNSNLISVTGYFNGSAMFGNTNLTGYGGEDIFIARVEEVSPPNTPANIQITISGNQVHLSWDEIPNCTYTVYSDSNPKGNFSTVEQTAITATNWSETISGAKLFYRVTASN